MRKHLAELLTLFSLVLISSTAAESTSEFPAPYNSERGNPTPTSPQEALSKIRLPEGFKATLFAAEPDIQNPIGCTWDHRGRLWVAENYTYAETSKKFDLGLRDRVVILEDTDHDGRAETRKVFTDKIQRLTSVEIGEGGVWVMAPPQLLFIPDANGDDVPDAPPQVVLDGFTVADANYHNLANGLKWGPDGWLYGRCGIACPGNIGLPGAPDTERRPIHGGIWRFHPERKTVEVLTYGTVNPWGHDWDENGEGFFINTVTGHLWPLIPGAFNKQMDGFPSQQNPAVYERMEMIADHWHFDTKGKWQDSRDGRANDFGGGHAHVGMMIYQADQWPALFRNKLFTLNLHGRRANVERLEREGSGYRGRHEPDAFFFDDPWFRGIEISTGPDGSAYVLDWSDTGECHESNGVHRTSGRIYKISFGDPTGPALGDLETLTADGVERLLRHPNVWYERQLRTRLLSQTVDPEISRRLLAITTDPNNSTVHRLRALWACNALGPIPPPVLLSLLKEKDEHLRVWAIRLLTDGLPLDSITGPRTITPPVDSAILETLVQLAARDESGLVKLALASALQRLPVKQRFQVANTLVQDAAYMDDPHLPYLVWFGIIPLGEADPTALIQIARTSIWPQTTRWISRNFTSRLDSRMAEMDQLLAIVPQLSEPLQTAVLQGISEGLAGRKTAPVPSNWSDIASRIKRSERSTPLLVRLGTVFGDTDALDALKAVVRDSKAEIASRKAALRSLVEVQPADLREICESLLDNPEFAPTAVRGLSLFGDQAIGTALAKRYANLTPEGREEVISVLTTRPAWAAILLEELKNGAIPRTALTAFAARQIAAFKDANLSKRLSEVWGTMNDSTAEKRAQIQKLNAQLTPQILANADLGRGRQLFTTLCSACHTLYGTGGNIGPDLTGSGRAHLDYILENVVDPSAAVSADYRVTTLTLKDGRLLAGTIATQTDRTLSLRQPSGTMTVEKTEITKQEASALSMMPEGLLNTLQPEQIRDLVAYLMHPSQVAPPPAH
ncbi:PVC-type heme-binding CxxCH protein [Verrucomicrobiota bacterium sgz303538]